MRGEPLAVYLKFVAFGFTAEDRVVVENETGERLFTRSASFKEQCRRQAADAATGHDAIEFFARVNDFRERAVERMIADLMTGGNNFVGVAIGCRIIAHTAEAGPVFFREKLQRRQRLQKHAARGYKRGVQQITAFDRRVHAQRIVWINGSAHGTQPTVAANERWFRIEGVFRPRARSSVG